jgi:pimeloyl-ACP methyl ester carboxylesterase
MLGANQLLRSPFHIWNDVRTMSLSFDGYSHVLYERPEFNLGVLERKSTAEDTEVVVIFPDFRSSVGFWHPVLSQMPVDQNIRLIEWFGESDSVWLEQSVVFTDLDLMLSTVLSDDPDNVHIVAQGLGAWLALRYQQQFPEKSIRVTAIQPEGLQEATLYPQSLLELDGVQESWIGEQWLPKFARLDWLEWLDNPVKLAIHREMHLESVLEHPSMTENTRVIFLGDESTDGWSECSQEVAWTCSDKVLELFE